MVHKIPYRISSLLLALFIFISSAGISLNMHYCGDELYDYSLIGQTKSCKADNSIDNSNSLKLNDAGCCSFDHFKIETSQDYKFSDFDIEAIVNFDLSFTKILTKTFLENSISVVNNRIYPPPGKIKKNTIYLKIESLLI